MKVKELIEKLKELDQEKDIYIPNSEKCYKYPEYYIAHSVLEKTLTVLDEDDDVVVIDFE